jgi:hypothetical protein
MAIHQILIRPMNHPAQPESIVKSKKEKKRSTSDGYNARERAVGQKESQERNSSLRNSEAVGKEMQVERQSLCKWKKSKGYRREVEGRRGR